MKVTVYIPCRNYADYVAEAIESILRQTYEHWELFLFNNASSDNTIEVFSNYASDPRIRIFTNDKASIPAAANLALEHACGDYLVRLDADDYFDDNALLVLATHLDNRPQCALVSPDYYLVDDEGSIFAHEMRKAYRKADHQMDLPPNGACTMMRISMLKELGGYREDIDAQDGLDLWSRASEKYKIDHINLPLFYYRRHGSNMTESSERIFIARRDIKHFKAKDTLEEHHPIIAVIPCRQHYDFIPDLWSAKIGDQTLLELNLKKCISSKLFTDIVVLSDTEAVNNIIEKCNDSRVKYVHRPSNMTIRSCPLADSLSLVSEHVENFSKGITVLPYIQAIFTTIQSIEESITTLLINHADSSVAMDEMQSPIYQRSSFGLIPIGNSQASSNGFSKLYAESRTCQAALNVNILRGALVGSRVVHFEIPHKESFFIKNNADIEIACLLNYLPKTQS